MGMRERKNNYRTLRSFALYISFVAVGAVHPCSSCSDWNREAVGTVSFSCNFGTDGFLEQREDPMPTWRQRDRSILTYLSVSLTACQSDFVKLELTCEPCEMPTMSIQMTPRSPTLWSLCYELFPELWSRLGNNVSQTRFTFQNFVAIQFRFSWRKLNYISNYAQKWM